MKRGVTTTILAALVAVPLLLSGCASASIPDSVATDAPTVTAPATTTVPTPTSEPVGERPDASEVASAILALLAEYGSSIPEDQALCMGEELVASALTDEELQILVGDSGAPEFADHTAEFSAAMETAATACGVEAGSATEDPTDPSTPGAEGDECDALVDAYFEYTSDFSTAFITLTTSPKGGYAEMSDAQDTFAAVVDSTPDGDGKDEAERVLAIGKQILADLEPIKDKESTADLTVDEWDILLDGTDALTDLSGSTLYGQCY